MLKFFLICAGVVFCSLTTMIGILIVVWGDQIQFADYVLPYTRNQIIIIMKIDILLLILLHQPEFLLVYPG